MHSDLSFDAYMTQSRPLKVSSVSTRNETNHRSFYSQNKENSNYDNLKNAGFKNFDFKKYTHIQNVNFENITLIET